MSKWKKVPLVNQPRVADVNCPKCGHVVHYAACDAPLTWYQRLRHRRAICGCNWWGADYAHKRVRDPPEFPGKREGTITPHEKPRKRYGNSTTGRGGGDR